MKDLYGSIDMKRVYLLNNKKDTAVDILIDGVIGSSFFDEGITRKALKKEIDRAGQVDQVNLFFNSPGGLVHEGMAIYNYIAQLDARVVAHIDGIAASAASVVAMAADEIRIYDGAEIMIHNASAVAFGDRRTMDKVSEILVRADRMINTIYQARTGMDKKRIAAMMDDETYMSAEEALKMGFADSRVPAKAKSVDARAAVAGVHNEINGLYQKWAETVIRDGLEGDVAETYQIAATMTRPARREPAITTPTDPDNKGGETMDKEAIQKMINDQVGPIKDRLANVNAALGIGEDDDPVTAITTLQNSTASAAQSLAERERADFEAKIDSVINGAKKDGKLFPAGEGAVRAMVAGWQSAASADADFSVNLNGAKIKIADGGAVNALKAYFAASPKLVNIDSESGAGADPALERIDTSGLPADVRAEQRRDKHLGVDDDSMKLDRKIKAYMRANNCDYLDAYQAVCNTTLPGEPDFSSLDAAMDDGAIVPE